MKFLKVKSITEQGMNLSQGERQLLGITRTILSNPKILILDEATSNVDSLTELKIKEGIERLMKGKTCFIIAHRFSTIKNSNHIVVIDKGKIIEQGKYNYLISKKHKKG